MICRAVHHQRRAIVFPNNATHVGEELGPQFCVNGGSTIFCAENDVGQQIGKCVSHVLSPLRSHD
jgi:hypothetical protein